MRLIIQTREDSGKAVALTDGSGKLWEYHSEGQHNKPVLLGNIYLGRVLNVEPAIQAAFIDIGERRSAFLHFSDIHPGYDGGSRLAFEAFNDSFPRRRGTGNIQDCVQPGQLMVVQISKDAIGQKGPSVTTYVSVPGRNLVLLGGAQKPGISRRIEDEDERHRLRDLAGQLPVIAGAGVIVRTAGFETNVEELTHEVMTLGETWNLLSTKALNASAPVKLHQEDDLLGKVARDLFLPYIDEILIDDEKQSALLKNELCRWNLQDDFKIDLYRGKTSLFRHRGLQDQIDSIYDRTVRLAGGGAIVIEETEALVAIDVNSGRGMSAVDLEETALTTNLEAASEVARQIRLRDLGGVVVCDFIDMLEESNRDALENHFREATREDRAKIWYAPISRFGLLEITRQRLGPSKNRQGRISCPTCNGRGTVRIEHRVAPGLLRELGRGLAIEGVLEAIVTVEEGVKDRLREIRGDEILTLEEKTGTRIILESGKDWSPECWAIRYR